MQDIINRKDRLYNEVEELLRRIEISDVDSIP